jgi:hypothetical protein
VISDFVGSAFGRTFLVLSLLTATACSEGSEYLLLRDFFGASRLRDRTALASFSTVIFEPREQGIVTTFSISRVGPEHRWPIDVARDRRVAELSLDDPLQPIDVRTATGEMISKEIVVSAPVRGMDGQSRPTVLAVVIERAVVAERRGRWIVTGFQ